VFGVKVEYWVGEDMVFVTTPGSGDLLTLNQDPAIADRAGDNGGLDHFGFKLADPADLDAAVDAVIAAGGTLERRGEHSPGERFAYCRDVDGYLFEL
jgi:catechol 2,3-dioxygenase-like lactoylglutathione lyase family enzyme